METAQAAAVTNFAPHRAIYDIKLAHAETRSGISDIDGRMIYELSGNACDGYTQNMRFVTRATTRQGSREVSDLSTSSWEAANGDRLRFNATQYQNERLAQSTQGDAGRKDVNSPVDVTINKPAFRTLKLKPDTYFPMQHATALIEAARAGKTRLAANLYDGSEKGDKVYATNAVIGPQWKPGEKPFEKKFKDSEKLQALPSWSVAISYFEPGSEKTDAVPVYELSFRYFDNGITSKLLIDYGDFALTGALRELTFLEESACKAD